MKIALLVLLGLMLGVLGGAALGVGAGLAWVEIFKTTSFEGYSGMLVFFTFMPLGAAIGGLGGALLFGVIATRDAEIAIGREPAPARPLNCADTGQHLCNAKLSLRFGQMRSIQAATVSAASRPGVTNDACQSRLLICKIQFRKQTA